MNAPADLSESDTAIALLLRPTRLWSVVEILRDFDCVPKLPGIYAWYFDDIPPGVPTAECHTSVENKMLLYVGIAPKKVSPAVIPSTRTLRDRLRNHLTGNAEGSTLRLSLGCLLADQLEICLQRVGSGKSHTFTNPGEIMLDNWLAAHAHVALAAVERPWEVEAKMLSIHSLPLNLSGNGSHSFAADLKRIRAVARCKAATLPVVADSGGPRRLIGNQIAPLLDIGCRSPHYTKSRTE